MSLTNSIIADFSRCESSFDYKYFKPWDAPWKPEERNGPKREALRRDILKNGLMQPILVDKAGNVIDGLARLRICEEIEIPVLFYVVELEKGMAIVLASLKNRELTVFDEVRLIDFLKPRAEKMNRGSGIRIATAMSKFMKDEFGWFRHSGARTMGDYFSVCRRLPSLDEKQIAMLRTATSISAAVKKLSTPRAASSVKRLPRESKAVRAVRQHITEHLGIVTDRDNVKQLQAFYDAMRKLGMESAKK